MSGSSKRRGQSPQSREGRFLEQSKSALRGARWLPIAALSFLALGAAACNGSIGDSGTGSKSTGSGPNAALAGVADHSRFPRLSHAQWENTVQDLFHLDAPTGLSTAFYPDALGGKAFDNNEEKLEVTPELWANYEKAAETVATTIVGDPAKLAKIVPANLPTDPVAAKTAFIKTFGLRAFRRPLTDDEVTTFSATFDQGPTQAPSISDPFVAGVSLVIESMLQSPYFIYRSELSTKVGDDGLIHLDSYEVATKLSYTLWNTMPDDTLMASAAAGELQTKDSIESSIKTMMDDPRARATLVDFHHQLYQADQYTNLVTKDKTLYPNFDPAVAADMQKELDLFVGSVLDDGGGLKELLTSTTTFVNSRLAPIYGLDPSGMSVDQFTKVSLDPTQRSGLMTRAGFLAWKGTEAEPDTILRGVFINRRILCQGLPDPPAAAVGAKLGDQPTDRARVEALTGQGTCGETCHGQYIDPIGYAFENYDAIGGWRTQDDGQPVDASSTFAFDGTPASYQNAVELSALAASSQQANQCYATFWLQFAYGRDTATKDQNLLDTLTALSAGGGSTHDIVVELLTSDSFLTRTTEVDQ